ncbi:MAG: SGNH/GDSL hydrolase family protein [Leptolyngbyaceae cyanobacterium bins.59]|nr:SGNH/GDSL hydrolase family protein [Leptolyngbyaceae cyanobacterium bins.59]
MKLRWRFWVGFAFLTILVGGEIGLRLFGFGHPALLQADPNMGYRYQPNQNLRRFGKRIVYNQYSQRSEPISLEKPPGTLRILMVGDSLLNGGNPTDQSQTITELFENHLREAGFEAEVLNASAGSWGMGNRLGYLQEFGVFQSDAVILQIASHDLTQPTSTSKWIGVDLNYPDRAPLLAWQELFVRYLWPFLSVRPPFNHFLVNPRVSEIPVSVDPNHDLRQNQQLLKATILLLREKKVPVYVLFIPETRDLRVEGEPEAYQKFKAKAMQQKNDFLQLLRSLQVPVIDVYPAWTQLPASEMLRYYRDYVHVNEAGNAAIAKTLFDELCTYKQLVACAR